LELASEDLWVIGDDWISFAYFGGKRKKRGCSPQRKEEEEFTAEVAEGGRGRGEESVN